MKINNILYMFSYNSSYYNLNYPIYTTYSYSPFYKFTFIYQYQMSTFLNSFVYRNNKRSEGFPYNSCRLIKLRVIFLAYDKIIEFIILYNILLLDELMHIQIRFYIGVSTSFRIINNSALQCQRKAVLHIYFYQRMNIFVD